MYSVSGLPPCREVFPKFVKNSFPRLLLDKFVKQNIPFTSNRDFTRLSDDFRAA